MDTIIVATLCIIGVIAWALDRAADRDAAEFERCRMDYGRGF